MKSNVSEMQHVLEKLDHQSKVLDQHSKILDQHSQKLADHDTHLSSIDEKLKLLDVIYTTVVRIETVMNNERISDIEQHLQLPIIYKAK